MTSRQRKIRLAGILATLITLALAVSCKGFFPDATLSSITIQPAAPQVQFNMPGQAALQAFGVDSNNNRKQLTTGVAWSSQTPAVVTIDQNTGVPNGASLGTGTIQASAQGLSATATATVYLTGVTAITVSPNKANISLASSTLTASFTAAATVGSSSTDITSGTTWTLSPATTLITCAFTSPSEVCTAQLGSTGTYTLTAAYPGTTQTGTATLNVTP